MKSVTEFFGCEPIQEGLTDPVNNECYMYESEKLKYEIHISLIDKLFFISGDFTLPFGGNSLFEICVEFDRVNLETEPKAYGEQKILVCRKDYPEFNNFKTLMVMKWENSELSVWPNYIKPKE